MSDHTPTIGQTIEAIQHGLRDYIEATYHVGNASVVRQRRELLESDGVITQRPFLESTPRYQLGEAFERLPDPQPSEAAAADPFHAQSGRAPNDLRPALHASVGGRRLRAP